MKIVINTYKTELHNAKEALQLTLAAINDGHSEYDGTYRDKYLSFRIDLNNSEKELSDEEIMEIVADKYEKGHGRYIDTKLFFVEFARAILRKAQEK